MIDEIIDELQPWERRLRWLAGKDKTPKPIVEDLIMCFQEIE